MSLIKGNRDSRIESILNSAYKLFTDNTIESVTIQNIADNANVGVATLYRYYKNKPELVISLCTKVWSDYFNLIKIDEIIKKLNNEDAIYRLDCTLKLYINLFENDKRILKFNNNFNSYIVHENVPNDKLIE